MNMPPSLDDDDAEVILDDVVLEEYDVPGADLQPSAARSSEADKPHRVLWGLGLLMLGVGMLFLARGALHGHRSWRHRLRRLHA
jgi:hypothetical protein